MNEGTTGDGPKRRLGSVAVLGAHSPAEMRQAGAKVLTMGIVGCLAGANSFVMAGWSWRVGAALKRMHLHDG